MQGDNNREVIHFEILYEDGERDTVIALLKITEQSLISSIDQVWGSKQEAQKWLNQAQLVN